MLENLYSNSFFRCNSPQLPCITLPLPDTRSFSTTNKNYIQLDWRVCALVCCMYIPHMRGYREIEIEKRERENTYEKFQFQNRASHWLLWGGYRMFGEQIFHLLRFHVICSSRFLSICEIYTIRIYVYIYLDLVLNRIRIVIWYTSYALLYIINVICVCVLFAVYAAPNILDKQLYKSNTKKILHFVFGMYFIISVR